MDWTKVLEVGTVVLFTSTGQLLMRFAARGSNLSLANGLTPMISSVAHNPILWLGIVAYGVSTLLWINILSRYPVGSVYPMVAIGYVLVTLGGSVFLGEKVPPQAWLALALICAGTLLLASSPWQGSPS